MSFVSWWFGSSANLGLGFFESFVSWWFGSFANLGLGFFESWGLYIVFRVFWDRVFSALGVRVFFFGWVRVFLELGVRVF